MWPLAHHWLFEVDLDKNGVCIASRLSRGVVFFLKMIKSDHYLMKWMSSWFMISKLMFLRTTLSAHILHQYTSCKCSALDCREVRAVLLFVHRCFSLVPSFSFCWNSLSEVSKHTKTQLNSLSNTVVHQDLNWPWTMCFFFSLCPMRQVLASRSRKSEGWRGLRLKAQTKHAYENVCCWYFVCRWWLPHLKSFD